MIHSASQAPAFKQNNQNLSPTAENPGPPIFSRKPADSMVDSSMQPNMDGKQLRYIRFGPGGEAVSFMSGPSGIEPNNKPQSESLKLLRNNCGAMLHSLNHMRGAESQKRGIPFMTRNGEQGRVKLENGMATILVDDKPVLKWFGESHLLKDVHIMMAGPDGRMRAGRNLSQNDLSRANALVQSAHDFMTGQGQSQRMIPRWK